MLEKGNGPTFQISNGKEDEMPLLRLYATLRDDYGCSSVVRVGHTYTAIHKALEAARKASMRYGEVEVKDDSVSIHHRLLSVYREGKQVGA